MGWFDPKRARREERQYRKQKRLQKWMEREWPLIRMQEDVQWSDRINRYRTRATPPGWIFGCSEVEQGDTGAGVLPPSDWARVADRSLISDPKQGVEGPEDSTNKAEIKGDLEIPLPES